MSFKEFVKKFIPRPLLSVYHYKLAFLGALFFSFPGLDKSLKIIGVTGTSGKSTTVGFIARILEESGKKTASTSSIRFKIAEKEWENKYKMTMPGRFAIQKFLKKAKNAGCEFVVLEVTSEGIRQFRHKFINFDTAVFTNLTSEHVESHGSFEKYRNEKLKLFKVAKNIHVINVDDKNAQHFLDIPAKNKVAFSIKDVQDIQTDNKGVTFLLQGTRFKLNIIGKFNIYNALTAISVVKTYGINLEICRTALEKAKAMPGRMEIVATNPIVVVDYAHTPDQLEAVYKAFLNENLICVLGSCGGGRDKWRRPVLGKIASQYCKKIFITNEDPYDEDPIEIINQIAETADPNAQKILDRKEAIEKAVKSAQSDEVVIITGKGAEPWMCVANGKKIPWDDRKIAEGAVERG